LIYTLFNLTPDCMPGAAFRCQRFLQNILRRQNV
jgi:hypothetical protein